MNYTLTDTETTEPGAKGHGKSPLPLNQNHFAVFRGGRLSWLVLPLFDQISGLAQVLDLVASSVPHSAHVGECVAAAASRTACPSVPGLSLTSASALACSFEMRLVLSLTVAHIRTKHQQGQVAGMTKDGCWSHPDIIFVVTDALEGVREDEVPCGRASLERVGTGTHWHSTVHRNG